MSTDLNSQGSSTTSRKRSKWEESDDVEDLSAPTQVPAAKKRTKHSKRPRLQTDRISSSPPPSPPPPARHNYSVYVPPRTWHPTIRSSRSVYCYERLNQIEEGSYGVVFRAKDKQTGDIVALKKLKLDEEKNGFPITALREVHSLMTCRHENVVRIREVVVGDTLTQYVYLTLFFCLVAIYNTPVFRVFKYTVSNFSFRVLL
jgi:cell division cycle 2-like protein